MSSGVASYETGSLKVHKRTDGIEVVLPIPEVHVFPRDFLVRELNEAVRIRVTIPSTPPVEYDVLSFDGLHGEDIVAQRHYPPKSPDAPPRVSWLKRWRAKRG